MKLRRRRFLHLAAGAAALPAVSRIARAQAYPTKPVRLRARLFARCAREIIWAISINRCSGASGDVMGIAHARREGRRAWRIEDARNRADGPTHLLRGDVVGADDVAPELDLALELRARCFRRLLVGREQLMPPSSNVLRTVASASAWRSAALSRSTIGPGVPAGTNRMCQNPRSSFL